ncbi:MAG: hypothetical protein ACOX4U_02815 [Anaerovoracaceae bacterium]|jgi:urocanate hydratase
MGCKELNLMIETENYSALVAKGKPVAVFKTRRNADGTYSNYVEMFNCSKEQVAFVQGVLNSRQAGDCHA